VIFGGAFLASGPSNADPIDAASAPTASVERISTGSTQHLVGVTHFAYSRGRNRPLPTTVWYPAPGRLRRGAKMAALKDAAPAPGRYPLIVWSHGLYSSPEDHQDIAKFFAANGFVVVAAAYPYTKKNGKNFNRADVPNQALDASFLITRLLEKGNPLAAHIDPARMAASGHSAGGTTTNGLFTKHRDPRLKAGIVISGRPLGAYTGSPVPLLFIHGDKDPVVAYDQGRTAYAAVPWPKAFLTLVGCQHGAGLGEPERGHTQVMTTMLDFLRWTLDRDLDARDRLPADGTLAGVARFESVGISGPGQQASAPVSQPLG
jgi:dienelactone hydrolase